MREMQVQVITVGDELLRGGVVNGNALVLGRALYELGLPVAEQRSVGDDLEVIRGAIEEGARRFPVVIVTGGLGPTPDDKTREALAAVAGVPLVESAAVTRRLTEMARRRGRTTSRGTALQAMQPAGAELLENPLGQAPGIWLEHEGTVICALPGVPEELRAILREVLLPRLAALPGRLEIGSVTLHTIGVPESAMMEVVEAAELGPVTVAYLPGRGRLDLRLDAHGAGAEVACEAAVARVRTLLERRFGPIVYGEDEEELAAVVLEALRGRGWRLALAESCTGGLIATWLTDVPGSSSVFAGSLVAYANEAKWTLLGVPESLLARHGAVSEAVSTAMAAGVRQRLAVEVGLAVTGIAGPDGGTAEKPVGLVFVALEGPRGALVKTLRLTGSRGQIRRRTAMRALDLIRRYALDLESDVRQ